MGVVNTIRVSFTLSHYRDSPQWTPVGDCWCLLCVFLCFSESWSCKGRAQPQTLPRRSRRQSLPCVLALTCNHTVIRCAWGIIDHCFWVLLSSLCLKTSLLFYFALLHPSSSSSSSPSFSLGSSAGSADAGVCEENHRSRRIQDGWGNTHTHIHTDATTGWDTENLFLSLQPAVKTL